MRKIATWNVRSIFHVRNVNILIEEMKRLDIETSGFSLVRWSHSEQCQLDDYLIYYPDYDDQNRYNGLAIVLNKETQKSVFSFVPISDRVIYLQHNSKPFNINVIPGYAATSEYSDDAIEVFYEQVQTARIFTKKSELLILLWVNLPQNLEAFKKQSLLEGTEYAWGWPFLILSEKGFCRV